MNILDTYSLYLIFEKLELIDLLKCSDVCTKWKQVINLNQLIICYGKGILPKEKCHNDFLRLHLKKYSKPHFLLDVTIFDYFKNILKENVEIFIFHEKVKFKLFNFFDFKMLPKLKYLEIRDSDFCYTNEEKFAKYIKKNGLKDIVSSNFYNASIETLVLNHINKTMLLTCFPNLKNLKVSLSFEFFSDSFSKDYRMEKLENFNNDFFTENVLSFLQTKCPILKSLKTSIKLNDIVRIMNSLNLKNICVEVLRDETGFFNQKLLNYEFFMKPDCILCINNTEIKNHKHLSSLIENYNLCKNLIKTYNDSISFDIDNQYLVIFYPLGIDVYKTIRKNSLIGSVKEFVLCYGYDFDKFILDLFSILPSSIESFFLSSSDEVLDNVLDLIPVHFPCLIKFKLRTQYITISKLGFISQLKSLEKIQFEKTFLDHQKLIEELEKLKFIENIHIEEYKNKNQILTLFEDFLKKKKNSVNFYLNDRKHTLPMISYYLRKSR